MQILVSIDDTDNLESRGTGALASQLAEELEENGWGKSGFVTRHQLLVHPDIPYTSHNSAMCFAAEIDAPHLDRVIVHAAAFLGRESAVGSDPGLCVVAVERLADAAPLVAFGRRAKEEVVTMAEAYALAKGMGIHLSEHGGTGQGVVGALAGAGLRLSGNDGRLKGHLGLAAGGRTTVSELCAHPEVDEVRSLTGETLPAGALVALGERVKTVLLDGRSVLLVEPGTGTDGTIPWRTCSKQRLREY